MKYIFYFLFFSSTVVGQVTTQQEYFPFYDNCLSEIEYHKCEKEILSQEVLGFITPEIKSDIIANFKDNKSVLTIAFVYQKNKPIREDIDIDFTNKELVEKIKYFLLNLKPLAKNDSIDDSLNVRHYEFVFLKNETNELFIASNEKLKENKHISEFKFGVRPSPKECTNALDIDDCVKKYFTNHIVKNFNYPNKAIRKGIEGKVDCKFYINIDGSLSILELIGPDKILEDEAERILNKVSKFIPGSIKGIPSKFLYTIPITFRLD